MLFAVPALLLLPPQSPDTGAATLRHADGRVPPTMTAVRVSRPPTLDGRLDDPAWTGAGPIRGFTERSEEHTAELQSQSNLVCRLLLEKKKNRRGRMGTKTPGGVAAIDRD